MLYNNLSCSALLFVLLSVLVCQSWAYYYEKRRNSCSIKPEDIPREEIDNACKIFGIVPDILSSPPPYFAKVQYGQNLCPRIGAIIQAHHLRFFPQKIEWPGRKNEFYTVMLIDPDAPSRHAAYEREFLHWLVVNVQGPDMLTRETLVDYIPPEPLIGTGMHRYTFLIYRQPEQMYFNEIHIKASRGDRRRSCFSARFFARTYGLELFAINFFRAEWIPKAS